MPGGDNDLHNVALECTTVAETRMLACPRPDRATDR
jgi:hypothetical protein